MVIITEQNTCICGIDLRLNVSPYDFTSDNRGSINYEGAKKLS